MSPLLLALATGAALAGGTLEVRASIPGGKVLVDGADTGLTAPAVIEGVQPGEHAVTVVGDCLRGDTTASVEDGGTTAVEVEVLQAGGTLVLELQPSAALVRMDGAAFPGTPGQPTAVACGDHALGATLDGYLPVFVNFSVAQGELVTLPVTLQPVGRGRIEVALAPKGARFMLDGVEVGRGTQIVPDVPAGPHMLAAELAGHESWEESVILADGQVLTRIVDLAPLPASAPAIGRESRAKRGLGATLTAVGVGGLMTSGALMLVANNRYQDYLGRAEDINAGRSTETAAAAQAWRDDNVVPPAVGGAVAGGLGAVLAGAGVTILVKM
jgi:hypothetical protein